MNRLNRYIKYVFYLLIFSCILSNQHLAAASSGPFFKLYYAPLGIGSMFIPYKYQSSSSIKAGSTSVDDEKKTLTTLSGYKLTVGFFYDRFQLEGSYFESSIENQMIRIKSGTQYNEISLSGEFNEVLFKLGLRFCDPGDTSYNLLYSGWKTVGFDTSYNDTSASGSGFVIGFYGFQSKGLNSDFEFVYSYEVYFGVYRENNINFDYDVDPERKYALTGGISFGAGLQYEPYDISALLKFSLKANNIFYHESDDMEANAGNYGMYIGLELVYMIPGFKYNKRD